MMREELKLVDLIFYVLDSRAPASCKNPLFDEIFSGKRIIYVLNKADLADTAATEAWAAYLSRGGSAAAAVDSTASKSAFSLVKLARDACREKIRRYEAKGVKTAVRAMVTGVPNVGKSTLINNICGRAKTLTGDRPGVTRGKQWVRVNDYFELLDTPGTLYPKLDDETAARRLAYIGSVKDETFDAYALALSLIGELNALDPGILSARYKTEAASDPAVSLENFAKSRGCLLRGGDPDTARMAAALIDDFRKGRLGRLTLDPPPKNSEQV
jgi:ribosome biogenesis GTPase A